jgi:sedoheptulose-bisphosphatase
MKSKN